MSRNSLFRAASRQPHYLTLLAILLASTFAACGQEEGSLSPVDDVQSVQLALSTTPSPHKSFSTTGVSCSQSGDDWLCTVDLRHAHLRSAYGGIYPGSESFKRYPVWTYWSAFPSDGGGNAVIAVNTSFFNPRTDPAELSFPLKVYGNPLPLTYGKDCDPTKKKVKLLQYWIDRQSADIVDYTCTSAYDKDQLHAYGSAPDIIGGLEETVSVGVDKTQRTFVGVGDWDGSQYKTLLIFATKAMKLQKYAADQLRDAGASKVMMFDGGGSTQLVVDGSLVVPSSDSRSVTTSLIVYAP